MAKYIVGPDLTSTPAGYDGYFNTMSAASAGATDADTVDVLSATYDEETTINEAIDFTALSSGAILENSTGNYPVLLQQNKACTLTGFTLNSRVTGTSFLIYVYLDSQQKIIQSNYFNSQSGRCVWLRSGAGETQILNNTMVSTSSERVIRFEADAVATGNTISVSGGVEFLFYVENPGGSVDISGNEFSLTSDDKLPILIFPVNVPMVSIILNNNTCYAPGISDHVILVGSEGSGANDGSLNGAIIQGNTIYGILHTAPDTESVTNHAILVGHNINANVQRNKVYGQGYGLVLKGTNQTDTTGNTAFNLYKNCSFGLRVKGIVGVKVRHTTIYSDLSDAAGDSLVYISDNEGVGSGSITDFKNNIIVGSNTKKLIFIEASGSISNANYNAYISTIDPAGAPFRISGVDNSWDDWVTLGHDANSLYIHDNGVDYDVYLGSAPTVVDYTLDYNPIGTDGKLVNRSDNPLRDGGVSIVGVNEEGTLDAWSMPVIGTPNIGNDQSVAVSLLDGVIEDTVSSEVSAVGPILIMVKGNLGGGVVIVEADIGGGYAKAYTFTISGRTSLKRLNFSSGVTYRAKLVGSQGDDVDVTLATLIIS